MKSILIRLLAVLWAFSIIAFFTTGVGVMFFDKPWIDYQWLSLKLSIAPFVLITIASLVKYVIYGKD